MLTGCALTGFVMFLLQLPKTPAAPAANALASQAPPAAAAAPKKTEPVKAETPKSEPAKAEPVKTEAPAEAPKTASAPEAVSPDANSQKPRYDFYRLLKENRAAAGQLETSKNPTAAAPQDSSYMLQIASYKTPEEAQQLRAKLLLLNLDARSENVALRNGETWHRVLIGPLKNHAELTRVRGILNDNHYDSLVLKNNKPNPP